MPQVNRTSSPLIRIIIIIALLLLAASLTTWWRLVHNNPTNVFKRMLATSLATPAVSKRIHQVDDSQVLDQVSALTAAPQQAVRSLSVLQQTGEVQTSITTESIGTPTTDFVRYTDIHTTQTNAGGKAFDFNSVLGLWGKSDPANPSSGDPQLFNQTVLGVVPLANVPQPQRTQLLRQINDDKVYQLGADVKRQLVHGRPVYSYDVSVEPMAYVAMLKAFARSLGITQLEQVDPAQYADSEPLKFTFDIDVWSGQLTRVAYVGSERTETYGGYGARLQVEQPASSIGIDELQARLQQLQ